MAIPTMASPAMLALQRKVNTLQKQGMPVPQIGQILQNEAGSGTVPLAQLWQLMNYVKANAAQTQMPPPDSVAVQLADQVKQMAMQKAHPLGPVPQMGMQQPQPPLPPSGQQGSPSAGPPSPAGIPSLPAPNIGQPGAYARGGITSFADDGNDWDRLQHERTLHGDVAAEAMRRKMQESYRNPRDFALGTMRSAPESIHGNEVWPGYLHGHAAGGIVSFNGENGSSVDGTSDWQDAADIFKGFGKDAFYGTVGLLNQPGNAYDWLTSKTDQGLHALANHYRGVSPDDAEAKALAAKYPGQYSMMDAPVQMGAKPDFISMLRAREAANPFGTGPDAVNPLPSVGPNVYGGASSGSSAGLPGLVNKPDYIKVGEDPTVDEEVDNAQKAADKLGLGSMAKEANRYAGAEEAKSAKDIKYDRNLALADAGFKMAMVASQGGASFMGAAGAGGQELAQGLMKAKEKQDLADERIEDLKLKALDAADRGKEGVFKTAMEEYRAKSQERRTDVRTNAQLAVEYMKTQAEIAIARNHDSVLRLAYDKNDKALEGLHAQYAAHPTEENLEKIHNYLTKAYPEVVAALVGQQTKLQLDESDPQKQLLRNMIGGGGGDMSGWGAARIK